MKFYRTYKQKTDEHLMELICKNDQHAYAELYDRYSDPMYRYFYRMLYQNESLAEDFTQELFIRIYQKAPLFDTSRNFRKWCYTLAHNLCKNEYRRKSRRPGMEHPMILEGIAEETKEEEKQVSKEWLFQTMEKLSPVQREIIILKYQEGLTAKEISDIIDCPEGTVKSRLFYAIKQLAQKVKNKMVCL